MKQGLSLTELVTELDRQKEAKRDFVADTRRLTVAPAEKGLSMSISGEAYPINHHAMTQVGDKLKIPAKYVERLATDHPELLAHNVNQLFTKEPKNNMVRTLDGSVRAFMSERYRPLDNFDLAYSALPHLSQSNADIQSCQVTEKRLYIKAIRNDLVAEIPPPPGAVMGSGNTMYIETVQGGICLSNSEVGAGRLSIQPTILTQRCTNLATFPDLSFFKVHLGAKTGDGMDNVREFFSDDTKQKADTLVWQQVNDLIAAAMDGSIFQKIVGDLTKARLDPITRPIQEVMEITEKKFSFSKDETNGLLEHLIKGGDLSRFGLHNAVTRMSQDVADYDRASELETVGGKIIELKQSDWREIAIAA